MVRLAHLNLTVADRRTAMEFYRRWFGFARVLAQYDDGTTFVADGTGFELALAEGAARASSEWHFGFIGESPDEVRRLADELRRAGHEVYAVEDTSHYTGFKCRDPDGYELEVYVEPRA